MAAPVLAAAQNSGRPPLQGVPTTPITSLDAVSNLIILIVSWLTWLFFIAAFLFILYSGYLFLTSGGNPEDAKKARTQLTYAIIAVAIGILAFSIKSILANLLGASNVPL